MNAQSGQGPLYAFLRWRGWLGALLIGLAGGLLSLGLAVGWGSFGFGLVVVLPFVIGWSMGYDSVARTAYKVLLWGCVLVGLAMSAMWMHLAGMLCTLILASMVVAPMVFGGLAGHFMRRRLERERGRAPRIYSFVFFIPAIALLWGEARLPFDTSVEVVRTTREYPASPDEMWARITFYEDVALKPPALARIGLPAPVRTQGAIDRVGAVVRCVYETGYLIKEITELEPGERLAFDVVEQVGIEDRSIELIDGAFELEPIPGGTRVTLETRFRPLLQARVFWRPFEQAVTRALHEHVLDGMQP